jgi:hypothetical protein
MIVYGYDEKGVFIGELVPDENPLKKGSFLLPKNATETKPPLFGENEKPVFNGLDWELKPDFVGVKYWLADGSEHEVLNVGELLPVEALKEKPFALDRIKEIKARLIEIDSESIRPLRAIAAGTAVQFDTDKLTALETERKALVDEMVALNG